MPFKKLSPVRQSHLEVARSRLARSFNLKSNPQTSVVLVTDDGEAYYGNNIFLSHVTVMCAEISAMIAAVAGGSTTFESLYLVNGRRDNATPDLIMPCGVCRQWMVDFTGHNCKQRMKDDSTAQVKPIEVYCTTIQLDRVVITSSIELQPEHFSPVGKTQLTR